MDSAYAIEALQSRVKQQPLTQEAILSFLENKVIEVFFTVTAEKKGLIWEEGEKYNILIGMRELVDEPEVMLTHEIAHGIYNAFEKNSNAGDRLIEDEAKRFYRENTRFMRSLVTKLLMTERIL